MQIRQDSHTNRSTHPARERQAALPDDPPPRLPPERPEGEEYADGRENGQRPQDQSLQAGDLNREMRGRSLDAPEALQKVAGGKPRSGAATGSPARSFAPRQGRQSSLAPLPGHEEVARRIPVAAPLRGLPPATLFPSLRDEEADRLLKPGGQLLSSAGKAAASDSRSCSTVIGRFVMLVASSLALSKTPSRNRIWRRSAGVSLVST